MLAVGSTPRDLDDAARRDREQHRASLRRGIADVENRIKRTVRNLEVVDHPDQGLIRDINERRAELRARRDSLQAQLDELDERASSDPNPDLIDALPQLAIDLEELPEQLARDLFEALRLEIRYDRTSHRASCRITLSADTAAAASRVAGSLQPERPATAGQQPSHGTLVVEAACDLKCPD